MCDCLRLCDETCCELELERICYDEMERESMAYFYESQREIQRYLKRIRQLENALTANGISIPEDTTWLIYQFSDGETTVLNIVCKYGTYGL